MPLGNAAVPCPAGDKGQRHQASCEQHYKGGREGPCKERNPLVLTPDWVSCMCFVYPVLISPMCGTWMGSGGGHACSHKCACPSPHKFSQVLL